MKQIDRLLLREACAHLVLRDRNHGVWVDCKIPEVFHIIMKKYYSRLEDDDGWLYVIEAVINKNAVYHVVGESL